MLTFFIIFLSVFVFNLAPAFSPPTLMVLSYLAIVYHPLGWVLALTGAAGATAGRMALAKFASVVIRNRFLSEKTKNNLDVIKQELENRQKLTFGIFLFYAFSPFPSNQLFLAYGLTGLKLRYVSLPFFIGRLCSYFFWIYTATAVSHKLNAVTFSRKAFFGGYFILAQIFTLAVVYLFAKIDWQKLFKEKKFGLVK